MRLLTLSPSTWLVLAVQRLISALLPGVLQVNGGYGETIWTPTKRFVTPVEIIVASIVMDSSKEGNLN